MYDFFIYGYTLLLVSLFIVVIHCSFFFRFLFSFQHRCVALLYFNNSIEQCIINGNSQTESIFKGNSSFSHFHTSTLSHLLNINNKLPQHIKCISCCQFNVTRSVKPEIKFLRNNFFAITNSYPNCTNRFFRSAAIRSHNS